MDIQNTQECFVQLWLLLKRTRRLLGGQHQRFCIRHVLKLWFDSEATDQFIWEVCHQCERAGWYELDAAYSVAFPDSTPLNVNKKKRSPMGRFIQT